MVQLARSSWARVRQKCDTLTHIVFYYIKIYYIDYLISRDQVDGDEVEEFDYKTYVNQGLYEMRSGSAEVAIEYFDLAVSNDPDDEQPYIVRSKCLNK